MFSKKDVIGWIGNVAVIKADGGYMLVDWLNSDKRLFVADGGDK
jgi:hypothetical protein